MEVENHHLNRRHLHSWLFFHCHVSFPALGILGIRCIIWVSYDPNIPRQFYEGCLIDYGCVHFLFADLVQVILTWLPTSYPHRIFFPVPNVEEDLFYTNFANWRIQHIQRSPFFLVRCLQDWSRGLLGGSPQLVSG